MSMSYPDTALNQLRSLAGVIDRELAAGAPSEELRTAWHAMVKVLSLGPAPQTRACPRCGEVGMRLASRCSSCWSALTPQPLDPEPAMASAGAPASE